MMNTSEQTLDPAVEQGYPERAFELLVVFIVSISFLGLAAALMGCFKSGLFVVLGMLVTLAYHYALRLGGVALNRNRIGFNGFYILTIVLVGLFFRITPFHYVFGGQDQGVYVNIASSIERAGTVLAVDPVIDDMTSQHLGRYVKDNYTTDYLPGVFRTRGASGKIGAEFQFYHLFPVWMAIFGGIFGSDWGVYALTFFSILSLLFCYRLVHVVTGNDFYAFVAALLLALNPLHAFFSKWPVTEVPTLAFSLAGFSCFAVYWFSPAHQAKRNRRFLVLSALSFGCLFFTRISGFMYVPVLFALFASVLLTEPSREKANSVALWAVLVFLLYAISVWYGLTWSAAYSNFIYRSSFSKALGSGWRVGVSALVLALVFIACGARTARLKKFLAAALAWFSGMLGLIFAVVVVAGGFKIYQLAFTDRYSGDPWIAKLWGLAHKGWESVAASSLVVTSISVCPLIFLIFLYFMLVRWKEGPIQLAKFFLLSIFTYVALLQFLIPYQPYYDRYLLSELVPYMIIFVVWGWSLMAQGRGRKIVSCCLLLAAVYSGALAFLHVGKEEQRGAYDGLSRIVAEVGEKDLILLHGDDLRSQIKMPLVYIFGKHVVSISDDSLRNPEYVSHLMDVYDDVYIFSSTKVELEGLQDFGVRRVSYDSFDRGRLPPSRVTTRSYKLFLYKIQEGGGAVSLRRYRDALVSLPGSTGEVKDQTKISNGKAGFLVFGPYVSMPKAEYHLIVRGQARKVPTAWVDIVSGGGAVQHGRFSLKAARDGDAVLAEGRVELDVPVEDIEVRVHVGAEDEVTLEGYELVPVAPF